MQAKKLAQYIQSCNNILAEDSWAVWYFIAVQVLPSHQDFIKKQMKSYVELEEFVDQWIEQAKQELSLFGSKQFRGKSTNDIDIIDVAGALGYYVDDIPSIEDTKVINRVAIV